MLGCVDKLELPERGEDSMAPFMPFNFPMPFLQKPNGVSQSVLLTSLYCQSVPGQAIFEL
jgi:hypothetical protein